MKKGYSSKQKQIYQDYVLYGKESLLEILRNKDDHPSATIKVIKDILRHFERSIKAEIGVTSIAPVSKLAGIEEVYKFVDQRIQERETF